MSKVHFYQRITKNNSNSKSNSESWTGRLKTGWLEITIYFFLDLGNVFENVAFFGDLLLRCPDITHKVKLLLFYFTVGYLLYMFSAIDLVTPRNWL